MLKSLQGLLLFDDLSRQNTVIHRIHPAIKLMVTVVYLTTVVSFDRYEISALLPLILYPTLILSLADLPLKAILTRILLIEPLVIGIGIFNPILEGSIGWISFLSIIIKSVLCLAGAFLLIATTGIEQLGSALRFLKLPRMLVLQLILTYRYLIVLMEEVSRTLTAYRLRSPGRRGIDHRYWGQLTGQLMLRSFDRAERVYRAMCFKGFQGEYHTGRQGTVKPKDWLYLVMWIAFIILARIYDLPLLLGSFFV